MTLWGRVALAMVLLVVVTLGAILSADYLTGGGIGLKPLLAGGAVAVMVALLFANWIEKSLSQRLAAEAARQEEAHRALLASEQNAQAIIKTSLDAFFQTDLDGVIREWGPQAEALTGWTRKEAIGANVVDLLVPERLRDAHRQRRKKMISEELGKSAGTRFEASAMHRDGREFPVEVSATALRRGDSYRPQQLPQGHHRQASCRGAVDPGAEDGGGRPAHRRHRARVQQHAHGDHGDDRYPR